MLQKTTEIRNTIFKLNTSPFSKVIIWKLLKRESKNSIFKSYFNYRVVIFFKKDNSSQKTAELATLVCRLY